MSSAFKYVPDLATPYKPTDGLASEQLIQARREEVVREQIDESNAK